MLTALLLSLIAGLANVIGGFLAVTKKVQQQTLRYFVSTAAGFILAVTVLDLYPDVISGIKYGPLLILIGFTAIFLLENFFAVHAHGGKCEHEHTLMGKQWENSLAKHSAWAAFFGLLVHTFFDGAAITARFMVSQIAGLMVFVAVLSHKVPEGFSMSAIFQAGRFNRLYSFLAAAALGASTVLGATVVYFTKESQLSMVFLALATGSFTYIVTAELVPYVSGTKDKKGIIFFLLGIVLYYVTSLLLAKFGLK
jgi:zinc transporter ZupT